MKILEQTGKDVLIEMSAYESVLIRRVFVALEGVGYDDITDVMPLSKLELVILMNLFHNIQPFYFKDSLALT